MEFERQPRNTGLEDLMIVSECMGFIWDEVENLGYFHRRYFWKNVRIEFDRLNEIGILHSMDCQLEATNLSYENTLSRYGLWK